MQMALVWAQRSYLTVPIAASASQTAHAAKIKRNISVIFRLLNKAGVKSPLCFLQGE
jgi:hypothetical protein